MTFHPRSVVEFGLFFSQVSESLLSGKPLSQSAALIRRQFSASAVAIQVEDRLTQGSPLVVIVEGDDQLADASAYSEQSHERLAQLQEECQKLSAVAVNEAEGTRYTLKLFRERSANPFDAEEASVCEILVTQLRRGLELSAQLGTSEVERVLYSTVMDRLSVGVVLLDANRNIVKTSSMAAAHLASRDGLQNQLGRLRALYANEDRELQEALKDAIAAATSGEQAPATRGVSISRSSGSRNLGLVIQPIARPQSSIGSSAVVAIYIRDPEATTEVENDLVRQLFDLTPAEASLARRLAAGLSLEDAAASLAISRNTARAHLRSIFSKSGITRQTELVRLMLNSAAMLGACPRQVA